jgi:hypothetical protein
MEQDAAPAGSVGAPPAGTTTRLGELVDGRAPMPVRKRGPAPYGRRVWRAERRHALATVRDILTMTRRLARHLPHFGGDERGLRRTPRRK